MDCKTAIPQFATDEKGEGDGAVVKPFGMLFLWSDGGYSPDAQHGLQRDA